MKTSHNHSEEIPFTKAMWKERPGEAEEPNQNVVAGPDHEGPQGLLEYWPLL